MLLKFYFNTDFINNYQILKTQLLSRFSGREYIARYLSDLINVYSSRTDTMRDNPEISRLVPTAKDADISIQRLKNNQQGMFDMFDSAEDFPSLAALRSGAYERTEEIARSGEAISPKYVLQRATHRVVELLSHGKNIGPELKTLAAKLPRPDLTKVNTEPVKRARNHVKQLFSETHLPERGEQAKLTKDEAKIRAELANGTDLKDALHSLLDKSETVVSDRWQNHPNVRRLSQIIVPVGAGVGTRLAITKASEVMLGRAVPVLVPTLTSYITNMRLGAKDFYARVHSDQLQSKRKLGRGLEKTGRAFNYFENKTIRVITKVAERDKLINQIIPRWHDERNITTNINLNQEYMERWFTNANETNRQAFITEYKLLKLQSELTGGTFQVRETGSQLDEVSVDFRKNLLKMYRETLINVFAGETPFEPLQAGVAPKPQVEVTLRRLHEIDGDVDQQLKSMSRQIRIRLAGIAGAKSLMFYEISQVVIGIKEMNELRSALPATSVPGTREVRDQIIRPDVTPDTAPPVKPVIPKAADIGPIEGPPKPTREVIGRIIETPAAQTEMVSLKEGVKYLRDQVQPENFDPSEWGLKVGETEVQETMQKLINGELPFGDTGKHWAILQNGFRHLAADGNLTQLTDIQEKKMAAQLARAILAWQKGQLDNDSDMGKLFHYFNGTRSLVGKLKANDIIAIIEKMK